jgi:hypothetical protein
MVPLGSVAGDKLCFKIGGSAVEYSVEWLEICRLRQSFILCMQEPRIDGSLAMWKRVHREFERETF